jgi:hypothetical protein
MLSAAKGVPPRRRVQHGRLRNARWRTPADLAYDRKPFAGDGIKHLGHEDETLSRGKTGDPLAGDRKSFALKTAVGSRMPAKS